MKRDTPPPYAHLEDAVDKKDNKAETDFDMKKPRDTDTSSATVTEYTAPSEFSDQEDGTRTPDSQSSHGPSDYHVHALSKDSCELLPDQTAVWSHQKTKTRLSALAAVVLIKAGMVDVNDLDL